MEAQKSDVQTAQFMCGVVLFIMLVEICTCPSVSYLRNMLSDGNAYAHVESVRKTAPEIRWHIQCYHYETRHYTVTTTDDDGREYTRNFHCPPDRNSISAGVYLTDCF